MNRDKLNLNVFTAFSGYDSQCMALERLKENYPWFDYNLVGWSEIDEPAIVSHNAAFPEYAERNYGDISKINWNEVPDFDLFTYSSPCFVAGTKVIVKSDEYDDTRLVKIEDVKVGELVLTHDNEYKKVLEVMKTQYRGKVLYNIHNSWGDEVTCTPDHRFYCYTEDNKNEGIWVAAKDIRIDYHRPYVAQENRYGRHYDDFDICAGSEFWQITIEKTYEEEIFVYNLEVEENHSYTANMFVVHNCQDFSICGKQRGGTEGTGTRSSLLWECKKAIEAKRPKFCILENVKALTSRKFIRLFEKWIETVNDMGYTSRWAVLNSGDYDVPQGRERVFLVSIRKDDNDTGEYFFPAPMPIVRKITDFLEKEVPEEYYLDDRDVPKFLDLLNHTGSSFDELTEIHKDMVNDEEPRNIEAELVETIGFVPEREPEKENTETTEDNNINALF